MEKLLLPKPSSIGLILSYRCTSCCKHCMYASSPYWPNDWISLNELDHLVSKLSETISPAPLGPKSVSINSGLHFTGGEPFTNYPLLLGAVKIARKYNVPSTFVETNCFWCTSDDVARRHLTELKDSGLNGILVSVNPFILEYVPFERTERGVNVGYEVFQENLMVYQEYYRTLFKSLNLKTTLPFEDFMRKANTSWAYHIELLPMGRAVYKLDKLFKKYPAKYFFDQSCFLELTREWHVHIDNYGNYIPGYCGGISLGNTRNFESLFEGIALDNLPIIKALTTDIQTLYNIGVKEFNYKEQVEGYISKCHLCLDLRKHIIEEGSKFIELKPTEFYKNLLQSPYSTP
ncbi:MAG: radical SAM protein [Nitrososphaeria archaeon]